MRCPYLISCKQNLIKAKFPAITSQTFASVHYYIRTKYKLSRHNKSECRQYLAHSTNPLINCHGAINTDSMIDRLEVKSNRTKDYRKN